GRQRAGAPGGLERLPHRSAGWPPSLLHGASLARAASSSPRSERVELLRATCARRVLPFSVQRACIPLAHPAERAHCAPPPSSLHGASWRVQLLRRRSRQPLWLLRATLVQRVQPFVCLRACSALAHRAERALLAPPPSLLHRRIMARAASSSPQSE